MLCGKRKEINFRIKEWLGTGLNIQFFLLFSIQESKSRAKVRREEENTLQKNLQETQINFQQHPNDETKQELDFCRTQMEKFYDKRIEGTIIRSRARLHEYGEKSNKYFLSLEKRNNVRKHIWKLCLTGVITTDHKKYWMIFRARK